MQFNNINRIIGFVALIISSAVYMLTVQDSVPFWDCSEFAAAAIWQQVPHPPGAPLFLMIGKIFDVLIPFGDPGWKMNMVSVASSAATIWLLYHISVMVITNMIGKKPQDMGGILAVCGSALIGALAFTFSDTFWFNAVESEVYALSTLFVAVVVYLLMLWNEKADEPGHERYLLLMMYIIGLAIGVHLLAVLAIFTIGLVVYFRKYTTGNKIKFDGKFWLSGLVILAIFFAVYPFTIMWLPSLLAGNFPIKDQASVPLIYDSTFLIILTLAFIIGVAYLFFKSYKEKKGIISLLTMAFLFSLLGYTTYTHILIRSNANPPMNENEPKDFTELSRYIGREQYGNDESWPRRVKSSWEGQRFVDNYLERDASGEYVYGEWFEPRYESAINERWGVNRWGEPVRVPYKVWDKVNTSGELAYMWKYQMNHMYFRYLLWNFSGRVSDEQDASAVVLPMMEHVKMEDEALNWNSGYRDLYPISYYAIPLLFGLFGMVFHFYKDPKMAFAFLVMFLMMGVLMALAQKQQDPQPRERDYFYTGSFMIFAMWIGIGAYGLIEALSKKGYNTGISAGIVSLALLVVPVNMAVGNWDTHDRTGNYIPFDYSYNILQSCDEDAILFTYGDNDTFPLWYLQDVMGVRRDIRIVNLSLANTIWYVDQLKNREPWGTEKIPISIPDDQLKLREELHPEAPANLYYPLKKIDINDIPEETMKKYDPNWQGGSGSMSYTMPPRNQTDKGYTYSLSDLVLFDIVQGTQFKRPVYFSNTVSGDSYRGLEKYFRYEGMAMRICPTEQKSITGKQKIDLDIMTQCLMNIDNTENYSTTQQYGFKMRGLSDPDVYLDPVHRRLTDTYRLLYIQYAEALYDETKDLSKVEEVFDVLESNISETVFPSDLSIGYNKVAFLERINAKDAAAKAADDVISTVNKILSEPEIHRGRIYQELEGRAFGPYRLKADLMELKGDIDGAIKAYEDLAIAAENHTNRLRQSGASSEAIQRSLSVRYSAVLEQVQLRMNQLAETEGIEAATEYAQKTMAKFSQDTDPVYLQAVSEIQKRLEALKTRIDNTEVEADIPPDSALEENQ